MNNKYFSDKIFVSENSIYKVYLNSDILKKLYQFCHNTYPSETGGIIIGRYTENYSKAVITDITGPPDDSIMGDNIFIRGIKGLQKTLNIRWNKYNQYYIGEWHFHPNNSAIPSFQDDAQMFSLSRSNNVNCPEAILVIMGGDFASTIDIRGYIYKQNGEKLVLKEESSSIQVSN